MERESSHILNPRHARGRTLMALLFGVAAAVLVPAPSPALHALVGWDVGALTLVVVAWVRMFSSTSAAARECAAAEDPGWGGAFAFAIAASALSIFAALRIIGHARLVAGPNASLWVTLGVLAVVLSWVVTHTMFTLRYAHLYYGEGEVGGLDFPGGASPDDDDFAYFAFTIGMCFQVSDVVITSSQIRREALLHALLSFVYNTVILALSLNLVFSLLA